MKIFKYILLIIVLVIGVFLWIKFGNKKVIEVPDVVNIDFNLIERENVENYLKDNISTLSPVEAILGGTWYVLTSTIDLEKKSGTVIYEDGHIQEKKNFTYTVNDKREVINLTIK